MTAVFILEEGIIQDATWSDVLVAEVNSFLVGVWMMTKRKIDKIFG